MVGIVSEARARLVSPALYLLASLCFLLPFATVSCNTDRAKPLLDAAMQSSAAGARAGAAQVDACLDALRGKKFASYSGLTLVRGTDPAISSARQDACPGSERVASTAGGGDENIGPQGLAGAALAAVVLSLLFGIVPFRGRGLVVAILSGVAVVLLVLNENRLQALVTDRTAASLQARAGAGNPLAAAFANTDFFSVTPAIGFWLVVGILTVGALYNSAATILSEPGSKPGHAAPAGPP